MKISGYTTVRNAVEMDYPFEESIRSLLDFCDEVVVVDSSDKEDGTSVRLEALANEDSRIQVFQVATPWDAPNHGIYDGQMKALAREQCTGEYLFQIDADEVVPVGTRPKIEELLAKVNYLKGDAPLIALPVVEYWGGPDKVRIDVNPWKWRLSRNLPEITHGIPINLRWHKDGYLFARPGTDGCDYISANTGQVIQCVHFMTPSVETLRNSAITDPHSASMYQFWMTSVTEQLPTVYHFSWWSIYSKIMKYKMFWNDSWLTLYGEKQDKPVGWNPFFGNRPLAEVPDEEIKALARKLATETGGWIFHQPWDGSSRLSVQLPHSYPDIIKPWAEKHLLDSK